MAGGFSRLSASGAAISHAVYGVVSISKLSKGRFNVLTQKALAKAVGKHVKTPFPNNFMLPTR